MEWVHENIELMPHWMESHTDEKNASLKVKINEDQCREIYVVLYFFILFSHAQEWNKCCPWSTDHWVVTLSFLSLPFSPMFQEQWMNVFKSKLLLCWVILLCEVHVQVCRISQIKPTGFHFHVPKSMIYKELILPGLFQNANPCSSYLQKCIFELYIIRIHLQTQHICRKRWLRWKLSSLQSNWKLSQFQWYS